MEKGKKKDDPKQFTIPETYAFLKELDDEGDDPNLKAEIVKKISSSFFVFNYGPYEFRGVIAHRKNRILGLAKKVQTEIGIKVYLKPTEIFDRLVIEMDGLTVFTCKITNMKFDNDCLDYTSQLGYLKCIEAVANLKREILRGQEPLVDPIIHMTKSLY